MEPKPEEDALIVSSSDSQDPARRPASSGRRRRPRNHGLGLLRNALLTFMTTGMFLLVHGWLLGQGLGQLLLRSSQDIILSRLASIHPAPVHTTIVDISDLPNSKPDDMIMSDAISSDRIALVNFLKSLSTLHPRAVGIDIDFSRAQDLMITSNDPLLYSQVQAMEKEGIHVYLGAALGRARGNRAISSEVAESTACIWSPPDSEGMMPVSFQPTPGRPKFDSLAAAMANDSPFKPGPPSFPISALLNLGIIEDRQEVDNPDGSRSIMMPIDYSLSDLVPKVTYTASNSLESSKADLIDRFVLLGDWQRPDLNDVFPTYAGQFAPGVVHHAAQLETLMQSPLYRVGHLADVVLDIGLAVGVVIFAGISTSRETPLSEEEIEKKVKKIYVYASLAVIFITMAVTVTRVVWLSSWVVVASLLVHHNVHSWWAKWCESRMPWLFASKEIE